MYGVNSISVIHSDVAKDTAVSKDTTDTASASPSVKKKETMAAVKTVSQTCAEDHVILISGSCDLCSPSHSHTH